LSATDNLTGLLRFGLRHTADRAVLVLDDGGAIVSGAGFGPRFGAAAETDLAGRQLASLYARAGRDAGLPALHLVQAARDGSLLAETMAEGADLRPFPVEIRVDRLDRVGPDAVEHGSYTCIITDLSERRRAADALRAAAEERGARERALDETVRLREMLNGIAPAMLVLDREWRVQFLNERARDLLRIGEDQRRLDLRRKLARAGSGLLQQIERVLSERVPLEFEEHYPLSGAWFEVQATPIPAGVCVLFRDVSESRHHEEQLRSLALFEPLTSLPNRTLFTDRAAQAVANALRSGQVLSIIVVDVDIDAARGKAPAGDVLEHSVRVAAERLGTLLRRNDTLGQIGPSRFAVVQNALTHTAGAATYAGKLLDALDDREGGPAHGLRLSGRAGIAILRVDGETAEDLLSAAEAAAERATGAGASSFRFANDQLDVDIAARKQLEHELRDAVALEQFRVNYQPVIDAATGGLCGLEALLRWSHPTGRVVAADEFLGVADEMGLSDPLAAYVLREVCEQATAWRTAGLDVPPVSINVARSQIATAAFGQRLAEALDHHGLPAATIQIELPEPILAQNHAAAAAFVRQLHELGIAVLVDDFGSGPLPFAALCDLPFGGVKLAPAMLAGPAAPRALEAVRHLAGSLGWWVVVKGVESGEQLPLIAAFAGLAAQGYHVGPPAPPTEITGLLRTPSGVPAASD
jgi:diguanylate cyclase (GGDEF)-like protein